MKKGLKYYTSACGSHNGNFLKPLGFTSTDKLEEADVIVFGGGADVDPATYKEEEASRTYKSVAREKEEKADFEKGRKLNKFFIGICRGHQLITALAGGKLIQDVSGHAGSDHSMSTYDGLNLRVNSIHHQMVNPYNLKSKDYQILGWSTKRISDRYIGAKDKAMYLPWGFKEIEAIYFPKIRALGIQSHPEMMYSYKEYNPAVEWVQNTFIKIFENRF